MKPADAKANSKPVPPPTKSPPVPHATPAPSPSRSAASSARNGAGSTINSSLNSAMKAARGSPRNTAGSPSNYPPNTAINGGATGGIGGPSSYPPNTAINSGATGGSSSANAATPASQPSPHADAAPDAILRAIQTAARNRNGGAGAGPADNRQATRFHHCVPMTLHIDDPRSRGTRIVRAASSNVSAGGFAIIFDAALTPGSTVRAQFDSLPGKPQIAGIVRSCVHICGTQHRIGVEYQ